MKKFLFIALAAITLSSCADVSGALFAGGDGTYDFKNTYLDPEFQVDESKIHLLDLESGTQDTIYALYVGDFAQIATDTIIVFLHGNTPSMDSYWQTAGLFANLVNKHHYGFIMYDYRGFGWSTGRSTGAESMAADYDAVLSFLQSQGLTSERMVVVANSLGSLTCRTRRCWWIKNPCSKIGHGSASKYSECHHAKCDRFKSSSFNDNEL